MKKLRLTIATTIAIAAWSVALAQLYPLFGPATGILKGSAASPQTTAAASSDVISLWSGSCSASTYLRGDGSCITPPGTGVSSVGLTAPSVFSVSGSPVTSSGTLGLSFATGQTANEVLASPNGSSGAVGLRALVGADVPAITLSASGNGGVTGTLGASNGGTGEAGTLTGILYGNGTSAHTVATNTNVIGLWSGSCSASTYLRGDGSCQTPSGTSSGANPTAVVGLTAVNGSAGTFLRSDGAPALDQTISPTWTGSHTWSGSTTEILTVKTSSSTAVAQHTYEDAGSNLEVVGANPSAAASQFTNGPSGPALNLGTLSSNVPIVIGTVGYYRMQISGNTASSGELQWYGNVAATSVDMTPDVASFTCSLSGMTATVSGTCVADRVGNIVMMRIPNMTGTSNSTAMILSGIPLSFQPANSQLVNIAQYTVENNTLNIPNATGQVVGGSVSFLVAGSGAGFTASGTKGFSSTTNIMWVLN